MTKIDIGLKDPDRSDAADCVVDFGGVVYEPELSDIEWYCDETSDHKMIVAIHDTSLGPALGGCRMWPYLSDDEAYADAARLARGMTYKAALAGLNFGGGKSVIIGNPKTDKSETLFRTFGQFIQSIGGRYITAEDVGTTVQDMEWVSRETRFVAGVSSGGGDPSPFTALGVFLGIKAAVHHRLGREDLRGVRVAIQGLGHVGSALCGLLQDAGARLAVTDIDDEAVARCVREFDAEAVARDAIYALDAEVFAPCALGAVINDKTLRHFGCAIVAGAANNQLLTDDHGEALRKRGILYAPDFVINAGGLMNVAGAFHADGYDAGRVRHKIARIAATLDEIFEQADQEGVATNRIADRIAESRMAARHNRA